MLSQKLQNKQPTPLQGVGLVLIIALAAVAGSAFFTRLTPRLGSVASLLFIAYGCAIAWFLLNWYALSFVYTATDDVLRICRAYGKRERFMADVWLNGLLAWGDEAEMKRRWPGAPVARATRAKCDLPPLALAYRQDGKVSILVIQPDEPMRRLLTGSRKKSNRRREDDSE